MSQPSNLNDVNEVIQNAQKAIACDQNCQNEKQAQELKNKYQNAEANLSLAEPQYQIAKKNYYTFVSGQSAYNEMIENEMSQKAKGIVDEVKKRIQKAYDEVEREINTYEAIHMNFQNLYDLYSQYLEDNRILEKTYKEKSNDVLTNERKTYYEEQQIQNLHRYYYILLIIYVLTVMAFLIFSMFSSSNTTLATRIGMLVFFVILPFVSTWLLGVIVYILYWLYGLLPKNVYL